MDSEGFLQRTFQHTRWLPRWAVLLGSCFVSWWPSLRLAISQLCLMPRSAALDVGWLPSGSWDSQLGLGQRRGTCAPERGPSRDSLPSLWCQSILATVKAGMTPASDSWQHHQPRLVADPFMHWAHLPPCSIYPERPSTRVCVSFSFSLFLA